MKKYTLIIIIALAFIFSFQAVNAQEKEAVEYVKKVTAEVSNLSQATIDYIVLSAHEKDSKAIELKRQDVVATIKQGRKQLNKIEPYKNNNRLKNEALDLFEEYENAYNLDYKEAAELHPKREESVKAMEMYLAALDRAESRVLKAAEKFEDAQQDYLKKYKITATYDEGRKKQLEKIAELGKYNRKVFLAYFKTAKVNALFLNAVNEKNLDESTKLRKELIDNARVSKAELKELGGFDGDNDYQKAALRLTEYYGMLAGKEYKELEGILENYTKLTQKDADRFTEIVNQINKKNQQLINSFVEANKKLRQKHTPKKM